MTDGFMPHGYCLRWDGPLLWVFIVGNLGIALAYFLIPMTLRFFIGKRNDLPYGYMFKLFAVFIFSCGVTHIAKVVTLWQPVYWIEAYLDLWTAAVSLLTAFLLVPLIPKALSLRSAKELEESNRQLEKSKAELDAVNKKLQAANEGLEEVVKARTIELEAALMEAKRGEEQFRTLFDMMPQLGWTAQPDGFIDFYNKGWYDYTGTTFEEMQGWGWEKVHDAQILPVVVERWKESLTNATPFAMEFPLRRRDGIFNVFATRVNPIFDQAGMLQRWVGINTNIQDKVETLEATAESERRFRHLAAALPDIVWILNAELEVTFLNERWTQYTGLTMDEGLGSRWHKVVHPDCLSDAVKSWVVARANKTPYELEQLLLAASGEYRWHLVRGVPVFDQQDEIFNWFGTCTDIHEKRAYREELEKAVESRTKELTLARDEAMEASAAKSRFLATVSHEVRTPMAGVIGLVELLSMSLEGQSKDVAKAALDSSKRLLQILNDLLDASKLQAGAIKLEYRQFAIRPVIGDVIQLISPQAEKKNLQILSQVSDEVPELICGDELRVRQILQNIAFNAVKFTSQGNIRFEVGVNKQEGASTSIEFSIADTGIGLTPEQQLKIFEPFVQADESTTRLFGGTGLGLSICRTLIDLMGGEISVTSEFGTGSVFRVIIPFRADLCKTS